MHKTNNTVKKEAICISILVLFIIYVVFRKNDNLFPMCVYIIGGVLLYFVFLKPKMKKIIILSIILCLVSGLSMAFEVIIYVDGMAAISSELRRVIYISLSDFFITEISMGGIFILKKVRKNHEKSN